MGRPLRVLVVEDSEDDALLVTGELRRGGFEVSWQRVETRETMAEALDRGGWDLILSDFKMPRFSAVEALELYREHGIETPFILVSGTIGEEQAVASLKAGAHDFFLKDHLKRLCPAVERELREAGNRRARREAERERERSQAALARSEARQRALLEALPDMLFVQSADGTFLDFHAPDSTALHVPPERFLGRQAREVLPADLAQGLKGAFDEALRTGRTQVVEYALDAPGHKRHYEARIAPCQGQLLVSVVRDVTARKQAEDELLRTQRFLQSIVDTIPGIVYIFDLQRGEAVYVNQEITPILGYTPDQVREMGASVVERLVHPDDVPRVREHQRRYLAAADDVSQEIEYRAKHASDTWRWLRSRDVVFARDNGGVRQLLGVAVDVTDQRRTQDLLQRAQKVEAIGRLAGGVAHDFNNFLGVITGHAELAQRQLGPDHPVRARVDQVLKAAERAANLTRQLLAFSRQQVMQPKVVDLNGIVADTQRMLGQLIGEDIALSVRAAPNVGMVKADPGQMEQIILNLCVNARDAMPRGGSLTIETANVELDEAQVAAHPPLQPGPHVVLAVSDTGVGMDEQTQRQIFEPFFSTKPEGEGTGLGLATVYGIVKQSGGFIGVYSEPGHGTTFRVYLPRVDHPAEAGPAGAAPAAAPRGHETILLVEDTDLLQEVIRETLEASGYTVLLASNGEEALALARERRGPIHLLLTDVVMPRLGGGDLAKRLSALRPDMRVLYMSGYTNAAISRHGVLSEDVMLLEKPFTADKLARAVREALDRPTAK